MSLYDIVLIHEGDDLNMDEQTALDITVVRGQDEDTGDGDRWGFSLSRVPGVQNVRRFGTETSRGLGDRGGLFPQPHAMGASWRSVPHIACCAHVHATHKACGHGGWRSVARYLNTVFALLASSRSCHRLPPHMTGLAPRHACGRRSDREILGLGSRWRLLDLPGHRGTGARVILCVPLLPPALCPRAPGRGRRAARTLLAARPPSHGACERSCSQQPGVPCLLARRPRCC